MKRPILIDLTINNEPVYRFRSCHIPRIGETLSNYGDEFRGEFEVIRVDHLLGKLVSSFDFEDNYIQLVTIEVKPVTQK